MRIGGLMLTAILGSCAVPPPAPYAPRQAVELAGRVAGAPQRCVSMQTDGAMRPSSTDRGTLIYGNGRTIWINRLSPGCGFDQSDVLVLEPLGSSYCANDIVRSIDTSRMPGPSCILGQWIPYKLP
jgi:hypothetical protein